MNDLVYSNLIDALKAVFPWTRVEVRPFEDEEDESIRHFVYVLDVPKSRLREVTLRAWAIALELYGETAVPFHLSALGTEKSAKYFPPAAPFPLVFRGSIGVARYEADLVPALAGAFTGAVRYSMRGFPNLQVSWAPSRLTEQILTNLLPGSIAIASCTSPKSMAIAVPYEALYAYAFGELLTLIGAQELHNVSNWSLAA